MENSDETNIVWFIESNRQKIECNFELNSAQQINFTGNLARNEEANTAMFFVIEEGKEFKLDFFSDVTVKVL